MIRLFVPDDLAADLTVSPAQVQAHYLLSVMRRSDGDEIALFNGRDGEWRARLVQVARRACRIEVLAQTRVQAPPPDLELLTAPVRRARLETIVEKAVELGVARIRLVLTRRTRAEAVKLARLQAIAMEAAEQTGRLEVPAVAAPEPLEQVLAGWPGERRLMFCDEAGDDPQAAWGGDRGRASPALQALQSVSSRAREPWAVLIGPEGGFDPAERAALRALDSVTPVSLGPRILRADTAAIAALALWQAALGDWRAADAPPPPDP